MTPSSTSESATAPENAFETRGDPHLLLAPEGLAGLHVGDAGVQESLPGRRDSSTAEAPGGPPLISTR